jgi:hypothetical protein
MNIRFVTKTVHAFLDYPVALSLMATPSRARENNRSPTPQNANRLGTRARGRAVTP